MQALLLLALYLLRTPGNVGNLGGWHIVGLAVRNAVELGLHRNIQRVGAKSYSPYEMEVRKRIFWSAYMLDRTMSLTLGRPFAVADHEIDVRVRHQPSSQVSY